MCQIGGCCYLVKNPVKSRVKVESPPPSVAVVCLVLSLALVSAYILCFLLMGLSWDRLGKGGGTAYASEVATGERV